MILFLAMNFRGSKSMLPQPCTGNGTGIGCVPNANIKCKESLHSELKFNGWGMRMSISREFECEIEVGLMYLALY